MTAEAEVKWHLGNWEPANFARLETLDGASLLLKLIIFIQSLYKRQHRGGCVLLPIFHKQS